MEPYLRITGSLLILLATIHIGFPKYFRWKEEFETVRLINRQMMYVHTFFIGYFVILIGILCLLDTNDLIHTPLGRHISFGLFLFWAVRLFSQLFIYSSELWKGKKFETAMHILFTLVWAYMTVVFFVISL